jgi:hypothetical protein
LSRPAIKKALPIPEAAGPFYYVIMVMATP